MFELRLKWLNGPTIGPVFLLMNAKIEMKNIIILEGIESDFGIASQPELIENIIRALMDTNVKKSL